MELNNAFEARRSIRRFKEGTQIDRSTVEEIIKAAQLAPSWKNSQTARYYVVMDSEKVSKFKSECLPEFNQKSSANAPVLIITAFEKSVSGFSADGSPENELGDEWGAYDLGLQNQNMLLKATELGLDTLIMGIRNSQAIREMLSIPDTQQIVAVIALGERDIEPTMPKRKLTEDIAVFI